MLIKVFLQSLHLIICTQAFTHLKAIGFDADSLQCASANISWMKFRKNTHCIRVLDDFMPKCIFEALFNANLKVWRQSVSSYVGRNIVLETEKTGCGCFMLTSKNISAVNELFPSSKRIFYPFTRIFIVDIVTGPIVPTERSNFSLSRNALDNIYRNALEVFFVEGWQNPSDGAVVFREIRNVLTQRSMNLPNITRKSLAQFYVSFRKHPVLDLKNTNKKFTIASFNCTPYFISVGEKPNRRYFNLFL